MITDQPGAECRARRGGRSCSGRQSGGFRPRSGRRRRAVSTGRCWPRSRPSCRRTTSTATWRGCSTWPSCATSSAKVRPRAPPGLDPIVFFQPQLILFFEGLRSERQLIATASPIWPTAGTWAMRSTGRRSLHPLAHPATVGTGRCSALLRRGGRALPRGGAGLGAGVVHRRHEGGGGRVRGLPHAPLLRGGAPGAPLPGRRPRWARRPGGGGQHPPRAEARGPEPSRRPPRPCRPPRPRGGRRPGCANAGATTGSRVRGARTGWSYTATTSAWPTWR